MSKTLSSYSNTLTSTNLNTGSLQFYNIAETLPDTNAYVKLSLTGFGTSLTNDTNGLLIESTVNKNFTAAIAEKKWLVTYSGYTTYAGATTSTDSLDISAYLDGSSLPSSVMAVSSYVDHIYTTFSKTFIVSIPVGQTFDLRALTNGPDVTIRFTLTMTQIS
jgi:hypothetical protein